MWMVALSKACSSATIVIFFLFGLLLFSGCSPTTVNESGTSVAESNNTAEPTSLPSTMAEARDALVSFLSLLHARKYEDAARLYGGEYEQLQVFNPEIDPNDRVALWTWVCENQLLRCLEIRSVTSLQVIGDSYVFQVEFNNPDGSLFVLGPCCRANETEMPPVSQFEYTVSRNVDHRYVVMNTPPYVP
jgi:hypothetical protein